MLSALQRWSTSNAVRGLAAASILFGAAGSASAGNGDGNFFQQLFGGDQAQQAPAQPQYERSEPDGGGGRYERRMDPRASRPLTVRLHRPKVHLAQPHAAQVHVAEVPTKPGRVSIYEDKTLRRGDAVMTIRGMRIFAGSRSWPYNAGDFVSVADAGRMDKGLQKTLIALDNLPRQ